MTHDTQRYSSTFTRRQIVGGIGGAALLLGSGASKAHAETAAPEPAISASPVAETRSVTTPFGLVEVPTNPLRIVALGEELMLANLLDLGIKPLASTASGNNEFLGLDPAATADIQILNTMEIDVETVVALQPDLLIAFTVFAEQVGIDLMNQIAPTVAVDANDGRAIYTNLAAIFGLEQKAETRLKEYDTAVKAAGETLSATDRTVSVISVYPGASIAVWLAGPADLPQVLLDMGFSLVPDLTTLEPAGSLNRAYLSIEELGVLTGEDLMMYQSTAIEGESESITQVTASDVWRFIPAVAANRTFTIDRFGYQGIPGRMKLIDELKTTLAR